MEEENSQTPHIGALFQRQLAKISDIFIQKKLAGLPQSKPIDPMNFLCLLFQFFCDGSSTFKSKLQPCNEQCLKTLQDLARLLDLVTEQEKKYGQRLSVHSNFYQQHMMVQQFLKLQKITQPSQSRKKSSLSIACFFGKNHGTAKTLYSGKTLG